MRESFADWTANRRVASMKGEVGGGQREKKRHQESRVSILPESWFSRFWPPVHDRFTIPKVYALYSTQELSRQPKDAHECTGRECGPKKKRSTTLRRFLAKSSSLPVPRVELVICNARKAKSEGNEQPKYTYSNKKETERRPGAERDLKRRKSESVYRLLLVPRRPFPVPLPFWPCPTACRWA